VRPQRRKWHKSLALERPISSPKGAAYRHDPDVDWQLADAIKFDFSATTPSWRARVVALNLAISWSAGTATDQPNDGNV
jgi:hypothetical protein